MHFRLRNHIVQVIRTTYDPATKKPRAEIVGRLQRTDPQVDDGLRGACTPVEIAEVERWIAGQMKARTVASEHAARSLGEQIGRASEWFAGTHDLDSAGLLAAEAQQQWLQLRSVLRARGLLD